MRESKGLSGQALADAMGRSRNTISNWMNANTRPSRAELDHLIDAVRALVGCSDDEEHFLLEAYAGVRMVPSSHNVPPSRTRFFTGRKKLLGQLDHHLALPRPVALTQAISISGLGGIGKTQVALEYAHLHQNDYSHVLWAMADSREALIAQFGILARDLDLPEKNEKDHNRVVAAVRRWLREHGNWLLILDNVEDLSLVTSPSFIPQGHRGAILLTTRLQATEQIALALEVESMSEEEGALLLLRRTNLLARDAALDVASPPDQYPEALEIARTLGGLPLALDQAGAYISETRCTLAAYLPIYEQHHADLLARRAQEPTEHPHPESVTTTFTRNFEWVEEHNPAAADLLRLCAFLAPDAIPEALIVTGREHLGPVLQPIVSDPHALNEAIAVLRRMSLIQRNTSARTLSLHRLVQAVLADQMSDAMQQDWITRCLRLLDQAFRSPHSGPVPREDPAAIREQAVWCAQLVPHVQVIVALSTVRPTPLIEATPLFQKTADYLSNLLEFGEAELLYHRALQIREQALGPDHPDVATTLLALANLYRLQHRDVEAISLCQRALQIREQAVGPEHLAPATLECSHGFWRHPRMEWCPVCDGSATAPINAMLDVATAMQDLAWLHTRQGHHAEAERFSCRALAIKEKALGRDAVGFEYVGPWFRTIRTNRDPLARAERLWQRAIQLREKGGRDAVISLYTSLRPESWHSNSFMDDWASDEDWWDGATPPDEVHPTESPAARTPTEPFPP